MTVILVHDKQSWWRWEENRHKWQYNNKINKMKQKKKVKAGFLFAWSFPICHTTTQLNLVMLYTLCVVHLHSVPISSKPQSDFFDFLHLSYLLYNQALVLTTVDRINVCHSFNYKFYYICCFTSTQKCQGFNSLRAF